MTVAAPEGRVIYQRPETLVDRSSHYCPGCGHGIIHRLVAEVIDELELAPRTIAVELGPLSWAPVGTGGAETVVPITIRVSAMKRNRVDPGVWEALDRVGRYSDSTAGGALRIEVDCLVENPADAARAS